MPPETRVLTPEYSSRLFQLADELKEMSEKFFDFDGGSSRRGQTRMDSEVAMVAKISQLCGYIKAIE